jgi:ABC-2 type transport system ATP-binding protein
MTGRPLGRARPQAPRLATKRRHVAVAASPAISASGLTKAYSSKTGIFDLDLDVPAGTVMALLGPNGAGKTTTVRILSTLLRPDRGTVRIGGFDALTQPDCVRALIGVANQASAVDERLSGRVNLNMFARLHRLSWRTARERTAELLERFDLTDAAGQVVRSYSGGMRRKLDLALSLIGRPSILFLDEPTTGLDPASRHALWDIIRGLVHDGATVLLTTQHLGEADVLADRITFVDAGRGITEGAPAQLKARIGGRHAEFALASADEAGQLATRLGTFESAIDGNRMRIAIGDRPADLARLMLAVEHSGIEPIDYQVRTPSLDDVYFALTGHDHAGRPAETQMAAR